jgi:hypothetical protein
MGMGEAKIISPLPATYNTTLLPSSAAQYPA